MKIRVIPALMAVVVQCAALLAVLLLVLLVGILAPTYIDFQLKTTLLLLVLLQAIFAATLSQLLGMASWWRWIHLLFPLAVWWASGWSVPNEVYLVGFIVSLSLFWTTFHSQVPFFPSRPAIWQEVLKLVPIYQNRPVRVIDIGSGLGDMSMYIAKMRPDSLVEGVEIAPLPWLISIMRAYFRRSAAVFKLGNYRCVDFADYDVIFAYLSPAAMSDLWEKAQAEMPQGSVLISYEFEIPNVAPSQIILSENQGPALYVWKMGLK